MLVMGNLWGQRVCTKSQRSSNNREPFIFFSKEIEKQGHFTLAPVKGGGCWRTLYQAPWGLQGAMRRVWSQGWWPAPGAGLASKRCCVLPEGFAATQVPLPLPLTPGNTATFLTFLLLLLFARLIFSAPCHLSFCFLALSQPPWRAFFLLSRE